jgi:hypothetical protein
MQTITQKEVQLAIDSLNDKDFVAQLSKDIGIPARFLSPQAENKPPRNE